jgi:acrylyl-CoA reductase (NADPH)/3-hydroxypropionyl-CoA dehydratase/3-hydroxypropionyl-CoA synthetase
VATWRAFGQLAQARQIVQVYRHLRLETHNLGEGQQVALLVIDSPPVNSLNERSLDELNTVLQHIAHQDSIRALIITGAGSAFVAGANVKELLEIGEAGDLASAQTPANAAHTAFSLLENLGKPVVAAVNGPALGGGCELVLACACVVADAQARFGQPEINLNLLPGYGGTQRLVRRLYQRRAEEGLIDALRLIASGRALEAREAQTAGLVDLVVEGQGPVEAAMSLLRDYLDGHGPLRDAMQRHQAYLESREQALPDIEALLSHPRLAPTLA